MVLGIFPQVFRYPPLRFAPPLQLLWTTLQKTCCCNFDVIFKCSEQLQRSSVILIVFTARQKSQIDISKPSAWLYPLRVLSHLTCLVWFNLGRFHTYSYWALVRITWWACKLGTFPPFFHTEKDPSKPKWVTSNHMRTFTLLIGQMCLGWELESKYRKKVCSGLVHISVRETLICNLTQSNGRVCICL